MDREWTKSNNQSSFNHFAHTKGNARNHFAKNFLVLLTQILSMQLPCNLFLLISTFTQDIKMVITSTSVNINPSLSIPKSSSLFIYLKKTVALTFFNPFVYLKFTALPWQLKMDNKISYGRISFSRPIRKILQVIIILKLSMFIYYLIKLENLFLSCKKKCFKIVLILLSLYLNIYLNGRNYISC